MKIIINSNRDAMLKRFPSFSSRNSANFGRSAISVGQVVPEIPPFTVSHSICTDLNDHPGEPKNGGIPPNGGEIGSPLQLQNI